eukprot:m.333874 g.333874  ORF g.333874 m.333874 type:complete len:59 (-) comp16067_c0_seq7:187-363(-)
MSSLHERALPQVDKRALLAAVNCPCFDQIHSHVIRMHLHPTQLHESTSFVHFFNIFYM